jgi:hypothetical protein
LPTRNLRPLKKPNECIPISSDDFAFAFEIAMKGVGKEILIRDPTSMGLTILDDEAGQSTEIRFTDMPMTRALIALKEHFGDNPDIYQSMVWRIFGLLRILRDPDLSYWMKPDPDDSDALLVHKALLDAAAILRLSEEGQFQKETLIGEAELIKFRDYPE